MPEGQPLVLKNFFPQETGQPSITKLVEAARADSRNPDRPAPTAARQVIFPNPSRASFLASWSASSPVFAEPEQA
jgi:hypothetical protein